MKYARQMAAMLAVGILSALLVPAAFGQDAADGPETVMATYRVKPAQIDAFLKMMPDYWAALRERDMVIPAPHVLLRGEENGKPIVVEILSWKAHGIPDDVPPEIQAYWDKINAMVEARDGHKGIEFPEMTIVPVKDLTAK
ncbi:MAG: hypothetical protein WB524_09295 [Acidobacteriaceae bacterium]